MPKLIVATSNQSMFEQATELLAAERQIGDVILTSSQTVVQDVLAAQGGEDAVVIARGYHAYLIRHQTTLPLVDMVLSGQEIALIAKQAIALCTKPCPHIAFIGFDAMFSDPAPIASLLDAELRMYCAKSPNAIAETVDAALANGADVIIGGEMAMSRAKEQGASALFLSSTKESISMALRMARRVQYGITTEKKKTLEFSALLNHSFDAVLKLDTTGHVTLANSMACGVFRLPEEELKQKSIFDLLELDDQDILSTALSESRDVYGIVVRTRREAFVANMAALANDEQKDGFILSLKAFQQIDELEETVRATRISNGYIAKTTFEDIPSVSPRMLEAIETASKYAQYDMPLLLDGEFGTKKTAFTQAIHNASPRRKNPFVRLNLAHITTAMQEEQLCGRTGTDAFKGALELAHRGTLCIEHVELLCANAQYILLNLIDNAHIRRPGMRAQLPVDVRVICTTHKDLHATASAGQFSLPLYYRLAHFRLTLPSIRAHREDIPLIITQELENLAKTVHKKVSLTPSAQALLHAQPWTGNEPELRLFLTKLVILSDGPQITESFVLKHLAAGGDQPPAKAAPVYQNKEQAELIEALESSGGNRSVCAQMLGISKTTLWRRLKKYGIQ